MHCVALLMAMSIAVAAGPPAAAAGSSPIEGLVETNGVRLQYLDWSGTGPTLILIHGLGDNPHVFDDLAPAFTDRFHVIAFARRGSGGSDAKAPYDETTLTEDLRGLMDALGIDRAALVGLSAGGVEATEFAKRYPSRVDRIIYFEGGYDGADPDLKTLVNAFPRGFWDTSPGSMASLDAYRAHLKVTEFAGVDDMGRVEPYLRQKVVVQSDGSVRYRVPGDVIAALYAALYANEPRDYTRIHCPVLAIFAETLYELDIEDTKRRDQLAAFEKRYWKPFQEKSIALLTRQLPGVQVVRVAGTHTTFHLTSRQQVVDAMRKFLITPASRAQPEGGTEAQAP